MAFKKQMGWWALLSGIALLAFGARMWIIPQFGGVSGGDAYNYLFITKSIMAGENPFTNTKRLPGYPALLIPIVATGKADVEYAMRTIQAVAAIWGMVMVVHITRSMQLPWQTGIFAATILAFQKDYFWTSTRPEPYTLYTALLLTALWLFIRGYQTPAIKRHIAFGIVLGYAAFTRQEGFMAAAVLGMCSLLYELYLSFWAPTRNPSASTADERGSRIKSGMTRYLLMYLPALLVVSPFFIHNIVAYHNPFYSPYLEGDRLQIVDSFLAFQDALWATWGVIGSMWKPAWDQLERLDFMSEIFITSALGLFAWYWYGRVSTHTKKFAALFFISIVFAIETLLYFLYDTSTFSRTVPIITAAWIIVSIPLFLFQTKWKGTLLLLIAVSQIGISTWFHPFAKHYQQVYPIIAFMLATTLCGNLPKKRIARSLIPIAAAIPFLLVSVIITQHINAAIDEQNEDTALDSVVYRASRYVQNLPGPIGFDQAYLPALFYFDLELQFLGDSEASLQQQKDWVQKNAIRTLVVTNTTRMFQNPDPTWKVLKTFKAAGKREFIFVSTVYAI